MKEAINWLLISHPWVEYRTRKDLLGEPEDGKDVQDAKKRILAHPLIKQVLSELDTWPGQAFSSHKSAGTLMHKLSFIAETGLNKDAPEIEEITENILAHTDKGVPQVKGNISPKYGGTGEDAMGWALCDAPLIIYSLIKLGRAEDVMAGLERLKGLCRENGWPCAVSPELGTFRGPGKKGDPCPYATLVMLKALAAAGDTESPEARAGCECLLGLWERSREDHPYIFYMGTDFRKLKAPLVWYDILHVADVLSGFERIRGDGRLIEITGLIESKASADGRYVPESVWQAWNDFDFGQKKEPSAWLTFLVMRILKRMRT